MTDHPILGMLILNALGLLLLCILNPRLEWQGWAGVFWLLVGAFFGASVYAEWLREGGKLCLNP